MDLTSPDGELVGARVGEASRRALEPLKTAPSRRRVDLPPAIMAVLEAHRANDGGLVFRSPNGQLIHESSFSNRAWKAVRDAAGMRPITFHELRHTATACF